MVLVVKKLLDNAGGIRDKCLIPGLGRSLEKGVARISVFLPGESFGQRSLARYGPQGHKELDMTEAT